MHIHRGELAGKFRDGLTRTIFLNGRDALQQKPLLGAIVRRNWINRGCVRINTNLTNFKRLATRDRGKKNTCSVFGKHVLHASPKARNNGVQQNKHAHKKRQANRNDGREDGSIAHATGAHGHQFVVGGESMKHQSCRKTR